MSEPHLIRQGVIADAEFCAAILNDWIDNTPWMPRLHSPEDVHRHYREFVFAERMVWVAGQPVIGFAALDTTTDHVTALYAAHPGQGVGKALLDHLKSLRQHLKLWTMQANIQAQKFYDREGFVVTTRTDGDNEEGLPDMLYEWSRT